MGYEATELVLPGTEEWLTKITGSKMPAIMGHSQYTSLYTLWVTMSYQLQDLNETTPAAERGHMLEDAMANWWLSKHPEFSAKKTNQWVHSDYPFITADPDRLLYNSHGTLVGILEVKTTTNGDELGKNGTDQFKQAWKDQVTLYQTVVGKDLPVYVVALVNMEYREFVLEPDYAYQKEIIDSAVNFYYSLKGQKYECEPDIEATSDVYELIRFVHPMIDGSTTELTEDCVRTIREAQDAKKRADQLMREAKIMATREMGLAKYGTFLDETITRRQAKGDNTPFIVFV